MAIAIAGAAAVIGLLAGPAGAQTSGPSTSGGAVGRPGFQAGASTGSVASGTCGDVNDSTCSGSGTAGTDSTSSGSAGAALGSTASGCASAVNDSTASGSPCPGPVVVTTPTTVRPATPTSGGTTGGSSTASAPRALALTGSFSGPLAAVALAALALGGVLLVASRRPQEG
jgi:hypothetical protein